MPDPETTSTETPPSTNATAAKPEAGNLPPTHTGPSFSERILNPDGTFTKEWRSEFKDEIGDSKYFDSIHDFRSLLKSAKGLSTLAGRALIPKADAPAEEWDKVLAAMGGVPKTGADYGLEVDGIEDESLGSFIKDSGYINRVADICVAAGLPTKLAERVANASFQRLQMEYAAMEEQKKEARTQVEKTWGGRVKWDDAVKRGREALATLCGHTADKPAEDMEGFMTLMDRAGLSDHPFFVSILERMASRMTPGKFVIGKQPAGPGQAQRTGFAAMAPRTYAAALGTGG